MQTIATDSTVRASLERLERALERPEDVARALRALPFDLPHPGAGATTARYEGLAEVAATDLSLARLFEGHTDALAILAEAGLEPERTARYGVWAAEPPSAKVVAERRGDTWTLHGTKKYCSGARGLDRALVTASTPDGARLFEIELRSDRLRPVADTWAAVGMSATESLDVTLDGAVAARAVGAPGFYLSRPGFWHGAIGVAACWYGGALGAVRLLEAHLRRGDPNDHQAAHLGAATATCAAMRSVLFEAARAIDAEPAHDTRTRALIVRHVVESGCQEVLLRVGRGSGTTPLVFDRAHAKRAADLPVYLRQHHAERDLAALGRSTLSCT